MGPRYGPSLKRVQDVIKGTIPLVRPHVFETAHFTKREIVLPGLQQRLETFLRIHTPAWYRDRFSVDLRVDQSSNGVQLLHYLRKKYRYLSRGEPGVTRKRPDINREVILFQSFPKKSLNFCAEILDTLTSKQPTIQGTLGNVYLKPATNLRTGRFSIFLGFELVAPAMDSLFEVLKEQFLPIKDAHLSEHGFPEKSGWEHHIWEHGRFPQVAARWHKHITVAEVTDESEAYKILKDLQAYEGKGFEFGILGLRLHLQPRLEVWKTEGGIDIPKLHLEFPFGGEVAKPRILSPDKTPQLMHWFLSQPKDSGEMKAHSTHSLATDKHMSNRLEAFSPGRVTATIPGAQRIQLGLSRQEEAVEAPIQQAPMVRYPKVNSDYNVASSSLSQPPRGSSTADSASSTSKPRLLVRRLQQKY